MPQGKMVRLYPMMVETTIQMEILKRFYREFQKKQKVGVLKECMNGTEGSYTYERNGHLFSCGILKEDMNEMPELFLLWASTTEVIDGENVGFVMGVSTSSIHEHKRPDVYARWQRTPRGRYNSHLSKNVQACLLGKDTVWNEEAYLILIEKFINVMEIV